MHVNQYDGLTIALSEAKFLSRVMRGRNVLERPRDEFVLFGRDGRVLHWDSPEIPSVFLRAQGIDARRVDKIANVII